MPWLHRQGCRRPDHSGGWKRLDDPRLWPYPVSVVSRYRARSWAAYQSAATTEEVVRMLAGLGRAIAGYHAIDVATLPELIAGPPPASPDPFEAQLRHLGDHIVGCAGPDGPAVRPPGPGYRLDMAANAKKDRIGPDDLGIDPAKGTDTQLFKWLVACLLFGRRISQEIAARAFAELDKDGVLKPQKLADADWQHLVDLLGAGGYKRYDESTADELIELGRTVQERYNGRLSRMLDGADSAKAVRDRVQEFKGIGPTAAGIFVRELDL